MERARSAVIRYQTVNFRFSFTQDLYSEGGQCSSYYVRNTNHPQNSVIESSNSIHDWNLWVCSWDRSQQQVCLYSVILGLGWKSRFQGLRSPSTDFLEAVCADCGLRAAFPLCGPPVGQCEPREDHPRKLNLDPEVTQLHPCHTLAWSSHRPAKIPGRGDKFYLLMGGPGSGRVYMGSEMAWVLYCIVKYHVTQPGIFWKKWQKM